MWRNLARLARYRGLIQSLVARELKARYRGSVLGVAWTLLNPLAELLVLFFVFGAVLPLKIPNYAAFLFTGLLVYGWSVKWQPCARSTDSATVLETLSLRLASVSAVVMNVYSVCPPPAEMPAAVISPVTRTRSPT